jgi:hypothetical protein
VIGGRNETPLETELISDGLLQALLQIGVANARIGEQSGRKTPASANSSSAQSAAFIQMSEGEWLARWAQLQVALISA